MIYYIPLTNMFKWLKDNDLLGARKPGSLRTHSLMSLQHLRGGKLSGDLVGVPEEQYETFLKLYAEEVDLKNTSITFSEFKSDPLFRMHFDIDLLEKCTLDDVFCINMSIIMQDVIKTYYPKSTDSDIFKCIICTTKTKDVGELIKNGYHVIYPNLSVTTEQAYQLRHNIVYKLNEILGERIPPLNPWYDAIDKSIYNNGLKMCGSYKKVKCDCNLSYNCLKCSNNEYYIEDRTYMPKHVLSGDGSIDVQNLQLLSHDTYETMKQTSIRFLTTQNAVTGFCKPVGVPMYPDTIQGGSRRKLKYMSRFFPDLQNEIMSNDVHLNDATKIVTWTGPGWFGPKKEIQEFIRTSFSIKYRELNVKSIIENIYTSPALGSPKSSRGQGLCHSSFEVAYLPGKVEKQYCVRVTGKGSQSCLNSSTCHSSNSIYFVITNDYCDQKCFFDSCKPCINRVIVPFDVKKFLFP